MREIHPSRGPRVFELSDEITREFPAMKVGEFLKERYEVLAHVGSGGMADVYRGWDELFCRDVAIKVLKRERISDAMRKRVLREARASCAVDHPHMVRVTDMGIVHDVPFLVMDLLRGMSLGDRLRQSSGGRLAWRDAISLFLPVMEALHAAHVAGVVHRDLKPENLFLHRRGEDEVLIVLDLGLVKFTDAEGNGARWTQTGFILGTAAYMAPEQANGGVIDRRTDVYSLGVTLYRALAGRHLFPGASGDGPIAAMTYHLYEAPPRLGDEFPAQLVEAVARAVAKDPEARHSSMAEFAAALRPCLDEPSAPTRRRWRPAQSLLHVAHVGLGAALSLALQQLSDAGAAAEVCAPPASPAPSVAVVVDDLEEQCVWAEPLAEAAPEVQDAGVLAPDAEPAMSSAGSRSRRARKVEAAAAASTSVSGQFLEASGAVRRCVRDHGDPDTRSLSVYVTLHADGGVASAGVLDDGDASFLLACVRERLLRLRFDPGPPGRREHTYRFTAGEVP